MESNDIRIVTLDESEWQAYRALRLEALRREPQAFGSKYEEQVEYPDNFWQDRLQLAAKGQGNWLLFAQAGGKLVGMAGAVVFDDHEPDTATLVSVYVTGPARGSGAAGMLMEAILRELAAAGMKKANLDVMVDQKAALRLYQRFGFTITGVVQNPMGDGRIHGEYHMERSLGPDDQEGMSLDSIPGSLQE